MNGKEEDHNSNEGPTTDASPDGVHDVVAKAHHCVKDPHGSHFIEKFHVVCEPGLQGLVPPYKDHQGSARHKLDGDLPPDEVDPKDQGQTKEESAHEIAKRYK